MAQSENQKHLRTITLEEHFATPEFMEGPGQKLKRNPRMTRVVDQLVDLGEKRIAAMDAAGISMQVLSLNSPGLEQLSADHAITLARQTNDSLAEAVRCYPDRLAGLAALPTPDPQAAVLELERAINELGFKGAVINGHVQGRYLDAAFFSPLLERMEALQVPVYLHPAQPPRPVVETSYTGNFSPEITYALSTSAWGWHIETATHILRLIVGGVFDRYPRLQFIIGHLGEGLPFFLERLDRQLPPQLTGLQHPVSHYLRSNVYYTISGFNFMDLFPLVQKQIGLERILFSADYPYSSMKEAVAFLEQLPVSDADKERIAHGSAEKVLKI